jgi:acyl-CoA thioesterase-1
VGPRIAQPRSRAVARFAALAQEEVTVVALGDSLTAGYGLSGSQGFVGQLQAWLDGRDAGVTVQNAGVSGDTTAGGLSRLGWALGEDADAVIVALGGNDFLRGTEPAESEGNLRGILTEVAGRGLPVLLVGIDAGPNYGPDYETAFDAMYPALAEEFGTLLEADWFEGLREEGVPLTETRSRYLQPDGIHPNAEGVARIVERLDRGCSSSPRRRRSVGAAYPGAGCRAASSRAERARPRPRRSWVLGAGSRDRRSGVP